MFLPEQPLSRHIASLGAAVAAQTADSQTHAKTPKLQFAAARHPSIERSLGEIINDQVEQLPTYNGAEHQQEVDGGITNQQQMRLLLYAASADNGLSSGVSKIFVILFS